MMPLVAIATCKAYADKTLPRLCASLRRAGVNDYVIVGDGFYEPTEVGGEKIQPALVPGMWDLTPLPTVESLGPDWTFLIGDTCEVDADFKERVSRWIKPAYDLVGLDPVYMDCFMGLYHISYLKRTLPFLKGHAGVSKHDLVVLETSSVLLSYARAYCFAKDATVLWDRQEDVYGVGRPRWHRHWSAFGVTKWTVAQWIHEIDEQRARIL